MPYRSKAQRAYMHVHLPDVAKRWDRKYGSEIKPKRKIRKRQNKA